MTEKQRTANARTNAAYWAGVADKDRLRKAKRKFHNRQAHRRRKAALEFFAPKTAEEFHLTAR